MKLLIVLLICSVLLLSGCNYQLNRVTFVDNNYSTYCCTPQCYKIGSCHYYCISHYERYADNTIIDQQDVIILNTEQLLNSGMSSAGCLIVG